MISMKGALSLEIGYNVKIALPDNQIYLSTLNEYPSERHKGEISVS